MARFSSLFFVYFVAFALCCISCNNNTKDINKGDHKYTNELVHETSPYLLQHAHNPVNWKAWNDETLKEAVAEDKMIIISIGYAACHWCHVMEHESFEDSTVAQIMNEHFVCIKVDREERPDVDDVYMTACQLSSGRGCGWPLNAFALPDGRPVWAGTYFPKDQWTNILNQFKKLKEEEPAKLQELAEKITAGINSSSSLEVVAGESEYTMNGLTSIANDFVGNIDMTYGGRKGAPKFPMPNNYDFLLQYHHMTGDQAALNAATLTLDKMALGGLYDQLGGGFARYSVDSIWLAPHFEKMLYDNGQLVSVYSHAYQLTKKPLYKQVVEETIAFAERELLDESGGFYSSLDADSEGEEGKYYVWQASEIDSLLTDAKAAALFKEYYSIAAAGNWEHTNILYTTDEDMAAKYTLTANEMDQSLAESRKILFDYRQSRIRPGTDDKVLTSWNGLMLKGYVDAYQALGTPAYKNMAVRNAAFIKKTALQKDGSLHRNYKNGTSTINGFLDDYATVIDAFVGMYEITFDEDYLQTALDLTNYVHEHFYDEKSKMYFYTSDQDAALIARKMELSDNVIPASNSIMARNLHKLGTLYYDQEMIARARQMMHNMTGDLLNSGQPNYYSNWCQLYATLVKPPYEVAVLGPEANEKAAILQRNYLPNALFLGGADEGSLQLLTDKLQEGATMIYVCQNKVCKLPTEDVAKALTLMD